MKSLSKWVAAAVILCNISILNSCANVSNDSEITETISTELIRTDQSWNGVDLPDYPQGETRIGGG